MYKVTQIIHELKCKISRKQINILIVELGESEEEQLEKYIVEIEMLVQQKEVPPPINGKQCKKCAYYEYCYI